ncbi:MAG: heat shock protein HspQ [Xanthomonadales bacterium]|nr:heat shock protein HspQ [Xanthomonadales bacterium]
MTEKSANHLGKFNLGQIVLHQRHQYRGAVYDVDPQFMLPEEWYEKVATTRPDKNQPWYKVLVDGGESEAYVAEQHLIALPDGDPIEHPALEDIFSGFEPGRYHPRHVMN